MDFRTMKRKELQALCKEHKIPANQTSLEMADRLTKLLEPQKKNSVKSCLKILKNSDDKLAKRVRFSRKEDQMFVFEKTNPREMRLARRKSIVIAEQAEEKSVQKKKAEEIDESKKGSRKRASGVADCESKPVTRRSVKLPKRKVRSDCPVSQEMEKAPRRSLRRNISKDACGNSVEEVEEAGNGASRVTRNTRQQKSSVMRYLG